MNTIEFNKIQNDVKVTGKLKEVKFPTVKLVQKLDDGYAYRCSNGLVVIQSIELTDGKEWLHTSFSRKSKIPTYSDIQFVKRIFIGEDKTAIMIFPGKDKYVNIMKYCLHLYCGDDNLPDFTHGTGSI